MKQTLLILFASTATAFGGDWMQWRGPELNGTCDAGILPVSWPLECSENVAWTGNLPGTGQSTPSASGQRIFLTTSDDDQLYAVCIDGLTGKIVWKRKTGKGRVPDVCTPAFDDGQLYLLDGKTRDLTCLDARTGREEWQEKIKSDKDFFASPRVGDGKSYIINLAGEVFAYASGKEPRLLGQRSMGGDHCAASIIAADHALYIRRQDRLVCARKEK